jgi:hypothetical protein
VVVRERHLPLLLDPYQVAPEPPAWGSTPLAEPDQPDWRPGWLPYEPPQFPGEPSPPAQTTNRHHQPAHQPAPRGALPSPVESAAHTLVTVGVTGLAVAATGLLVLGVRRRRW